MAERFFGRKSVNIAGINPDIIAAVGQRVAQSRLEDPVVVVFGDAETTEIESDDSERSAIGDFDPQHYKAFLRESLIQL